MNEWSHQDDLLVLSRWLTGPIKMTDWSCQEVWLVPSIWLTGPVKMTYWSCQDDLLVQSRWLTGPIKMTDWSCQEVWLVPSIWLTGPVKKSDLSHQYDWLVLSRWLTGLVRMTDRYKIYKMWPILLIKPIDDRVLLLSHLKLFCVGHWWSHGWLGWVVIIRTINRRGSAVVSKHSCRHITNKIMDLHII